MFGRFSLATVLFETRVSVNQIQGAERLVRSARRARRIDYYVIGWLMTEFFAICLGVHVHNSATRLALAVVAAYRLFDIFQSAINIAVFDGLRLPREQHGIANPERMVIGLAANFIEVINCFGLIYLCSNRLKNVTGWFDPYYFSGATQTTVGYGDIVPEGWIRMLVVVQALFGVFFGILLLARFLSVLPAMRNLNEPGLP